MTQVVLTQRTTAHYGAAVGPLAIVGLPFTVYLPPYIAEGGVVAVGLVGLLFSICTLWDGVVDPLIGTMIDRVYAGPAPHRRWMRIAAAPIALLLALIVLVGDTLPFAILLVVMIIFYSSSSLFDVAHLSWGAALANAPGANAPDNSSRIFGAREVGAKTMLIAAFAAPALAQFLIPGLSLQGRIIAYASLFLLAMPLALWAIARIPARPVIAEPGVGWRGEIILTLRFRPFLALVIVQLLSAFAFGALTSLFIFFADGTLRLDNRSALLLFGTFIGGALFTPMWTALARRFGKPRMMIAMAMWLISILGGSFVYLPQGLTQSIVFSTLVGSGFASLIFIHGMVADLAPLDRARCGRDRTALLYAIINVVQKAGSALAIALCYGLLDWFGFDAKFAAVSSDLVHLLFVALPALSWAIMCLFLLCLAREPALALRPVSD
jgi:glycoside/pentoside/hexuronide:cation symporter, GPH family